MTDTKRPSHLPDIAPLEAAASRVDSALQRLEDALIARDKTRDAQTQKLLQRVESVINQIEPLLTDTDSLRKEEAHS